MIVDKCSMETNLPSLGYCSVVIIWTCCVPQGWGEEASTPASTEETVAASNTVDFLTLLGLEDAQELSEARQAPPPPPPWGAPSPGFSVKESLSLWS